MPSPIGKLKWDYVRWRYRCCRRRQVVAALNVGVPASAMSAVAEGEALAAATGGHGAFLSSCRNWFISAPAPDCARSRRPAAVAAPGGSQHDAVGADKCGFRRCNQRMRRNSGQRLRQRAIASLMDDEACAAPDRPSRQAAQSMSCSCGSESGRTARSPDRPQLVGHRFNGAGRRRFLFRRGRHNKRRRSQQRAGDAEA